MTNQEKMASLQGQRESNLKDLTESVRTYLALFEMGPTLKGLTACLESYIRRDLVDYVARNGKEEVGEPTQAVGVMMETIALIGVLKDHIDFHELTMAEISELRIKIKDEHDHH